MKDNREKYDNVFMRILEISNVDELQNSHRFKTQLWDSLNNMQLICELENTFNCTFESNDVIAFYSYLSGIEILKAKGVNI